MARPSELPGWGGLTLLTAPEAAKRTLGWIFKDTPPANFFNWFWNLISLWTAYLDAKVNGSGSTNLIPFMGDALQVVDTFRVLNGWTMGTGSMRTPAGGNLFLETLATANHQIDTVLNNTRLFEMPIGPGDAIQIDSIDFTYQTLANENIQVLITGSSSGVVFDEVTATGVFNGTENLVESPAPKLDTSETWTLIVVMFPIGAANDMRFRDITLNWTITTQ